MAPIRPASLAAAVGAACLLAVSSAPAVAQEAPVDPAAELGTEPANWGLAPFLPIPAANLSAADRQQVRDLEDRQLRERRALEDKYAEEVRALLIRQAEEREALKSQLTP